MDVCPAVMESMVTYLLLLTDGCMECRERGVRATLLYDNYLVRSNHALSAANPTGGCKQLPESVPTLRKRYVVSLIALRVCVCERVCVCM